MFKNNPTLYFLLYSLGLQPPLTQTTKAEQDCLARLATGRKQLVEIGVWHGVNTLRFRQQMDPNGDLYAVDPFPKGRFGIQWEKQIARREAEKEQNGTLHWLEDISENAVKTFTQMTSEPVDFLFIDGDHSYDGVRTDWTLWSPLVVGGGIVALHDSRSHPGRSIDQCGAARFTREVIRADTRFELQEEVDSVSVFQRRIEK